MAAGDESARSEIETLDGVGKALVDALISFFAVAENCTAVTGDLAGVNHAAGRNCHGAVAGKPVFTGTLEKMTRAGKSAG